MEILLEREFIQFIRISVFLQCSCSSESTSSILLTKQIKILDPHTVLQMWKGNEIKPPQFFVIQILPPRAELREKRTYILFFPTDFTQNQKKIFH